MSKSKHKASSSGELGLGAIIAIVISWNTNHSILWCVIHGLFGWGYILYRLGGCGGPIPH